MFGFFRKKKNKIQQIINERGYEKAVALAAASVIERLPNREAAYEFILQELDGASLGNQSSKKAASESGIPASKYKGALERSVPAIDSARDHISNYSLQLAGDQLLMARFRVDIGAEVMKHFRFGRHSGEIEERPASDDDDDSGSNFSITNNGFKVTDRDTGDVLQAFIRDGMFHGTVYISVAGISAGLAPWSLESNPFEDAYNFSGSGHGPTGAWSFSITPSASFEEILQSCRDKYRQSQNESLGSEHRSAVIDSETKLADVVPKRTRTGYVFWDINDDLGKSADAIMQESMEVQMTYGYARRAAVAGMYLQGIVSKDVYEHVLAVFKALQVRTGHTVEFQKNAFQESIEFMKTYDPFITSFFVKAMVPLVEVQDSPPVRVDDENLFKAVLDTAFAAEEANRNRVG